MTNASASIARTAIGALTVLITSSTASLAQGPEQPTRSWEVRVASGEFVPMGGQQHSIKDGQVTAAQLSWVLRPSLAITGTFAWARSRDLTLMDTPKLDVFTSDLGVEARPAQWFGNKAVTVSPFVGLGAGVRTYNHRKQDISTSSMAVGYASVGGEFGISRVGLRLEVRDYVTGFNAPVVATRSGMRNDVVIMAAVRFNRQRAKN